MQHVPDDVACNPPVSSWSEVVQTCEGRDPSNCHCNTGFDYTTCFFYNNELSVERTTAGIDDGSGDGIELWARHRLDIRARELVRGHVFVK